METIVEFEWLCQQITVQEAEAAHRYRDHRFGKEPVPFGRNFQQWQALLSEMQDDDELWLFSTPFEDWQHLAGRAGIALVRGREIIRSIVTMWN